jgi:hypothetical protein
MLPQRLGGGVLISVLTVLTVLNILNILAILTVPFSGQRSHWCAGMGGRGRVR